MHLSFLQWTIYCTYICINFCITIKENNCALLVDMPWPLECWQPYRKTKHSHRGFYSINFSVGTGSIYSVRSIKEGTKKLLALAFIKIYIHVHTYVFQKIFLNMHFTFTWKDFYIKKTPIVQFSILTVQKYISKIIPVSTAS